MTSQEYGAAYSKYFQQTVRFISRKCRGNIEAEEIAQAAWVKGWEHREQYLGESSVHVWVTKIAINIWLANLRHERVAPKVIFNEADYQRTGYVEHHDACIDAVTILRFAKPADQALLLKHYVLGESIVEVATKLGLDPKLVKLHLWRSKRKIHATLKHKEKQWQKSLRS